MTNKVYQCYDQVLLGVLGLCRLDPNMIRAGGIPVSVDAQVEKEHCFVAFD
jgi:hypothetical protein